MDRNGIMLRIAPTKDHTAHAYNLLRWKTPDINVERCAELLGSTVKFIDGSVSSLSEFARRVTISPSARARAAPRRCCLPDYRITFFEI